MERSEIEVLRTLGKRYAEIAGDDHQRETVAGWRRLNSLQPTRPMVRLDQLPWGELDFGQKEAVCPRGLLRRVEMSLRRSIYQWEHFRADHVFLPRISVPKIVDNARCGPKLQLENIGLSQHYIEQLQDIESVRALEVPRVETDPDEDARRVEQLSEVFDGILPVRLSGHIRHSGLWDMITTVISPERLLYDLVDRPDYIAELIAKYVEIEMGILDQYEEAGLLEAAPEDIHCTGAFTDELPSPEYDGKKAKAKDTWTFAMAQMFSEVSPAMHDEYEIEPVKPLLERYGLVYYGCCEPLHNKIDIIRKLKTVRKISISPWAKKEPAAEQIHGDYVFSAKPNPSHVAMDAFDADLVRRDLEETVDACRRHDTPCELILKDVSTVRNDPSRLDEWERIAMEVVTAS